MNEEIEFLKKRVKALETMNHHLIERWDLLQQSLMDAWRSIYSIGMAESHKDISIGAELIESAQDNISALEDSQQDVSSTV
jgi:hypothetical protein